MVVDLPRSLWAGPPQGGSFTARMSHIVVLPSGVRPLGVLKINHQTLFKARGKYRAFYPATLNKVATA